MHVASHEGRRTGPFSLRGQKAGTSWPGVEGEGERAVHGRLEPQLSLKSAAQLSCLHFRSHLATEARQTHPGQVALRRSPGAWPPWIQALGRSSRTFHVIRSNGQSSERSRVPSLPSSQGWCLQLSVKGSLDILTLGERKSDTCALKLEPGHPVAWPISIQFCATWSMKLWIDVAHLVKVQGVVSVGAERRLLQLAGWFWILQQLDHRTGARRCLLFTCSC